MDELLDEEDGENRAVRTFLSQYQGDARTTHAKMRYALKMSGFDSTWPEWANQDQHLTKLGAQNWLRHLFALEPQLAIPSLTDAEIHDMISDEIGSEALGISEVSLLRLVRATEKVVIERMKGGGE